MKYVVPVYGAVLSMNQIKVFKVKCFTDGMRKNILGNTHYDMT